MSTTILDTHLHLYPCYDPARAFECFLDNTLAQDPHAKRIACLAERFDCDYFGALSRSDIVLEGFSVLEILRGEIRMRRERDQAELSIVPGRQIISREKIEVLALGCPEAISDGQPALDLVYQINHLGHVPVLPWSPGKWFGERGKLIRRLITELQPGDFLIGDTPLRPYGWPLPQLMKLAAERGFTIVAGSDPLPFGGEEKWLGAYHSVVDADPELSAEELLHALKAGETDLQCRSAGRRSNALTLLNRLRKNAASKKQMG